MKNKINATSTNANSNKVNDLLQQMGEFLAERLEKETPHKAIWNEFTQEPQENAASLAGILEVIFEAQPAVRRRVDGFMNKIIALEAQQVDHQDVKPGLEDALSTEIGEIRLLNDESETRLVQKGSEKGHPAYLYGNERAGFDTVQKEPKPKTKQIGDDIQIILIPDENVPFPHIFTHLENAIKQSDVLSIDDKHHLQEHLNEIHLQLIGERIYDEVKLANAFQEIWQTQTVYSDALIESLKRDIKKLPTQAQGFIIQLKTQQRE
jgi:hypothetical protein